MHSVTVFLTSVLALGVSAIPTPDSVTTPESAIVTFDMPAAPHHVEKRQTTGTIRLCVDFDAGGRCANVVIPSDAITTNPLEQGLSAFEVDGGALCERLGGCPSSAQLLTDGLRCNLGDSFNFFTGCGFFVNTGNQIQITSESGVRNFDGSLNDNLRCIQCVTTQDE
ncbi:hypothetical protein QBC34DRAFT_403899 [Podospora aff. communis PSN243]|uniref:Uncharacterized protein n=1 Tax=Podospora aff. communis PSN243 TaxID=3040156 RepID=A0AAV9GQW6_9PEZI|nr:hypothetical protein QBC34DRAFT_403899 [Podospora aff. communis PSN243]